MQPNPQALPTKDIAFSWLVQPLIAPSTTSLVYPSWRYPDPQEMVYAEVDNTNLNKRYKYTTFAKSQDRRMFRAVPRRIAFLYGNKFLLKDDNYRYPLPQLEDRRIPGQQILFRGLYDRVSDNLYIPKITTAYRIWPNTK